MSKSYERLYYYLRPAKTIERKMLCEALRRLLIAYELAEYRYVGFGSTFFSDFILIHKSLGLNDLINIEKEKEDRRRFVFNSPYKCIKLLFGESNEVLPKINWIRKRIILWLDYDNKLNEGMLTDIGTFISRAKAGSIILITIDISPDELLTEKKSKTRYEQLSDRIGRGKIPIEIEEKDLDAKNYPEICYNIVNNEIDEILTTRNGGLKDKLFYKQLFNFYYRDGSSPMLSFGGILYSDKDKSKIDRCNFNRLNFIKCNRNIYDPYKIDVPILTFREMRHLDKILPYENISEIKNKDRLKFLKTKMVEDYRKIYRYFPNFVEAEMH